MVNADQYRAMALQHHRWAGMCRSPESRGEHFRLGVVEDDDLRGARLRVCRRSAHRYR